MSFNKTPHEELSGKQKRREKNKQIREIRTHNKHDNSLTEDAANITGPIDATRFASARISEIHSMQGAIKKAGYALNELAFQSLPRGLRRRTASHNLNRLPARLRAKAAKEAAQSSATTPIKKKKTRKIKRPVKTVDEYLRRQKSKRWLETHMWHTKRMKMTNIWGHRIAAKPNLKSARVTYKSFTRLCIAHDASYMACIELKGDLDSIGKALNKVTDLGSASVTSARYIRGNRVGYTNLYEHLGFPHKLICPITFLWKPTQDVLWIWVHPSAYQEATQSLQQSIHDLDITIRDLQQELQMFELTGPRSTALLQAILDPVSDQGGNEVWKKLCSLRSSCSLSPGSVVGLVVNDPRLKFPQKVPPRTNKISPEEQRELTRLIADWPADAANCEAIWDANIRQSLFEKKASEYSLNQRREKNVVPGSKLEPGAEDSQVPLLLFQRGMPSTQASSEGVEGWSVILPRGWGMAFWKSLVFAGARVAGFEDVRAMHFESGHAYFPHDYPGTRAFESHRHQVRKEEQEVWERKPPAKRINFAKRGIEHPFECAFESLAAADHMEDENARPPYALVQGSALSAPLDRLQETIQAWIAKRGVDLNPADLVLDELLAKVRLSYVDRGKPMINAMIYLVQEEDIYKQCTLHIQTPLLKTKRKLNEMLEDASRTKISNYIPLKSQHIGYVTNGNFSFSRGYGLGIGACTLDGLRRLDGLDRSQERSVKRLVIVRNTTSLKARPARLEILL